MEDFIFEDSFEIISVDPDGKKFDRVSRIQAKGENSIHQLLLDINIELYPVHQNQKFSCALTKYIAFDSSGTPIEAENAWRGPSLADKYDYVMYGRVYKFEDITPGSKMALYVSYGGLLMRLEADPKKFRDISIGSNIYLLIRSL